MNCLKNMWQALLKFFSPEVVPDSGTLSVSEGHPTKPAKEKTEKLEDIFKEQTPDSIKRELEGYSTMGDPFKKDRNEIRKELKRMDPDSRRAI